MERLIIIVFVSKIQLQIMQFDTWAFSKSTKSRTEFQNTKIISDDTHWGLDGNLKKNIKKVNRNLF